MTREELRVFLQKWFCGCGSPQTASDALLRILEAYTEREPPNDYFKAWRLIDEWFPDEGMRYLALYWLTDLDLIEHGGSVNASWLTGLGERVRDALRREKTDEFEKLHAMHCVHGFDVDGPNAHDCATVE